MDQELAQRLEQWMASERLRQKEVAAATGLQAGYLNQIIRGRKRISAGVLLALASNYPRLNINWLLRGSGTMLVENVREQVLVSAISVQDRLEALERRVQALEKGGQQ